MKFEQYLTEMAEQEALAIFGLPVDALGNKILIKKRFRDLAKTNHPDKPGSADEMKKINAAYDVLKKSKKTSIDKIADYNKPFVKKGQRFEGYF